MKSRDNDTVENKRESTISDEDFHVENILEKAEALRKKGLIGESITSYNQAWEYFKNKNKVKKAAEVYEKIKFLKEDIPALMSMASLYKNTDDFDKAIECYQKILNIDGNHREALKEFSRLNFELNKYDFIMPCLKKLSIIEPDNVEVFLWTGSVLEKHGRIRKSVTNYLKAADNARKKGIYEQSREILKKILNISPNNMEALEKLKKIDREIEEVGEKKEKLPEILEKPYEKIETAEKKEERNDLAKATSEEIIETEDSKYTVSEETHEEHIDECGGAQKVYPVTSPNRLKQEIIEQSDNSQAEEERETSPEPLEKGEIFELTDNDNLHIELIEYLLSKKGMPLMLAINKNSHKFDHRFFEVFDYKRKEEENPKKASMLNYINSLISNLHIREKLAEQSEQKEREKPPKKEIVQEEQAHEKSYKEERYLDTITDTGKSSVSEGNNFYLDLLENLPENLPDKEIEEDLYETNTYIEKPADEENRLEDFDNEPAGNEDIIHNKKDDFYLDLLDRLIWTEENSLIPFIMEHLDNLDKRFFEILDNKLKHSTEESDEHKNSLTYLNMVISNLNIRDKSDEKRLYKEKSPSQPSEDLIDLQGDMIISRAESLIKHTPEVTVIKPEDSSLIIQFSEEEDIKGKEIEEKKAKKPVKLEFIDECLKKVIAVGATELHLTTGEKPNIRFWGELQPVDMPVLKEVLSDVLIAQMLSDEEKKEIEEHMHVDFMYNFTDHDRKTRRFRGNAYYHRTGLNIIMKLMPDKIPSIKNLGLPEIVSAFGRFEQGLVLVTGGSGSGKTTTLHALLDLINSERYAHIITIEDPIEFIHIPKKSIIRQRQIDLHTKSYLKALKASISEDPDVILISELRDPETIELAMVAAETGCLVLSSMNTLSCASTIERIIDSFPPEQNLQTGAMLSESLKAIVTQQLLPSRARSIRYPAVEILTGCTPLKSLIREQKIFQINSLIETNRSIGMQSMDSSILSLLKDKLITDEVAMEAATDKNNVKNFKASKTVGTTQEVISVLKKDRCAALGIITDPPVNNQGKIIKASLSPDYTLKDLFKVMVQEKASDLHIAVGLPPKMRLKGEIAELYLPAVSEEKSWELLSGIFSKKQMEIFSREWDLDFTYEVSNIARFRCNMLREQNGVGAIFRIIPPEIPSMEILGLPEVLKKIACYRQGLVIITGPAGSGKTTTMACLLDYINSTRSANILTIEEPLEFIHKNKKSRIFHREIGIHAASFREAVRAARKESVDIIMIGEMMEKDTLMEALLAADMGNLVLGIMHTTGVTRTVEKIIETFSGSMQGQIRSMLCNSLRAIVAQQLITTMDGTWRCAVIEVAINNQRLANVIRDGKTKMIDSVLHSSREEGMQSLDLALMQLVRDTKIDEETARLRSSNPRSFIIPKEFKPKW